MTRRGSGLSSLPLVGLPAQQRWGSHDSGGKGCGLEWAWTWIKPVVEAGEWYGLLEPTSSHTPAGVKVHKCGD